MAQEKYMVVKKKPASTKTSPTKSKPAKEPAKEKPIGVVTHYFNHLSVAIVKFKSPVSKGANVKIKGHTTDIEQIVAEMQYDHKDIETAKKGQEVGIKVKDHVREGDEVFAA